LVLPNHKHALSMGTELFPKTSETFTVFGVIKPPAHPEDGDGVTFTSWRGCLPEKNSLNSVATKASKLINQILVQYISRLSFSFSFLYLNISMCITILKTYGFNSQLFLDYFFCASILYRGYQDVLTLSTQSVRRYCNAVCVTGNHAANRNFATWSGL
jgi:hypothetical protein